MRRSTSPRCRTPPSGRIVLRVERGKPTSSGFSDWKILDLGGFLQKMLHGMARLRLVEEEGHLPFVEAEFRGEVDPQLLDRKSTRLNSSHVRISYAVFCLEKKKTDAQCQILLDHQHR